jgi:hypothetical protein
MSSPSMSRPVRDGDGMKASDTLGLLAEESRETMCGEGGGTTTKLPTPSPIYTFVFDVMSHHASCDQAISPCCWDDREMWVDVCNVECR